MSVSDAQIREPADPPAGPSRPDSQPTTPGEAAGRTEQHFPGGHPAGGQPTGEQTAGGQPGPDSSVTEGEKPARTKATRVAEGAWLGGVSTGLARHLGLPVMAIRVGFVALFVTQFLGALVYGVLWLVMPPENRVEAPGLESGNRTGMRGKDKPTSRRADIGAVLALAALGGGVIWIVQLSGWGISQQLFWPIAFACAGAALVWRQADTARQKQWRSEAGGKVWLAPFVASGGWPAVLRMVVGLGLIGAAVSLVFASQGNLQQLPEVLVMTLLALGGVAIVVAPWVYRSREALTEARNEKVRADARADMAAHLHDSVLQTLALIQRQSTDPKAVQTLARRQERELRTWLYGDELAASTLKAAISESAAEVEDEHGIPIEVVTVGDCDLDSDLNALVRAAREAMVNAAKHSGAAKIDVFAEAADDEVFAYVRDRGKGFSMDGIGEDRMGVRGSIIDRMERHGGRARIRSDAEDGTEVRLEMTR